MNFIACQKRNIHFSHTDIFVGFVGSPALLIPKDNITIQTTSSGVRTAVYCKVVTREMTADIFSKGILLSLLKYMGTLF